MITLVAAATALIAPALAVEPGFHATVGQWQVAGYRTSGACVMLMDSERPTSLRVVAVPHAASLTFSLKNDAWLSLKDEAKSRLSALFFTNGELTDTWDLAVISYHNNDRGPVINFTIDRAKNDGASFVDQFSTAGSISFYREKVPVARFDLTSSGKAISSLMSCREYLRAAPDFDPFAGDL